MSPTGRIVLSSLVYCDSEYFVFQDILPHLPKEKARLTAQESPKFTSRLGISKELLVGENHTTLVDRHFIDTNIRVSDTDACVISSIVIHSDSLEKVLRESFDKKLKLRVEQFKLNVESLTSTLFEWNFEPNRTSGIKKTKVNVQKSNGDRASPVVVVDDEDPTKAKAKTNSCSFKRPSQALEKSPRSSTLRSSLKRRMPEDESQNSAGKKSFVSSVSEAVMLRPRKKAKEATSAINLWVERNQDKTAEVTKNKRDKGVKNSPKKTPPPKELSNKGNSNRSPISGRNDAPDCSETPPNPSQNKNESTCEQDEPDQFASDNDEPISKPDQPAFENDQPISEDDQPMSEDDQLMDEDFQPIDEDGQSIDEDDQHIDEDDQHIDEDEQHLDEDEQHLNEDGQHINEDDKLIDEDDQHIDEDDQHIDEDDQHIDEDDQHIDEDDQHIDEDDIQHIDEDNKLLDEPTSDPGQPTSKSDQPSSEPDQPSSEPDQPTSEPDQPMSEPDQPTSEPDQPTSEPDQPTSQPDQPTSEPGQPSSDPGPPTSEPDQPTSEPDQPTSEPDQPTSQPDQPTSEPGQPSSDPGPPTSEPDQPTSEPDQPTSEPDQPASEPDQPTSEPDQTTCEPDQPISEPNQPTSEPDQPTSEPGQPTSKPDQPTSEPDQSTSEPDQPTSEPDQPTSEPGQLTSGVSGPDQLKCSDGEATCEDKKPSICENNQAMYESDHPIIEDDHSMGEDDDAQSASQNDSGVSQNGELSSLDDVATSSMDNSSFENSSTLIKNIKLQEKQLCSEPDDSVTCIDMTDVDNLSDAGELGSVPCDSTGNGNPENNDFHGNDQATGGSANSTTSNEHCLCTDEKEKDVKATKQMHSNKEANYILEGLVAAGCVVQVKQLLENINQEKTTKRAQMDVALKNLETQVRQKKKSNQQLQLNIKRKAKELEKLFENLRKGKAQCEILEGKYKVLEVEKAAVDAKLKKCLDILNSVD